MIHIYIPQNNTKERVYAIKQAFDIIGVAYLIHTDSNLSDYIIRYEDGELRIVDYFFSSFPEERSYLSRQNIPNEVRCFNNSFAPEGNIPIIYGENEILVDKKQITCKIDLFASIFYMLSRWEEVVIKERDYHKRFPASKSLAMKFGFIERPVVDEYCEMLWRMLVSIGCNEERKQRGYYINFTHDIDDFRQSSFRNLVKTIVYYKSISNIINTVLGLFSFKYDVYNTFSFLMDKSEQCNTKSHFYFMADEKNRFINTKQFKKTIHYIKERGHYVGFHPGYETYLNSIKWGKQHNRLTDICKFNINEGRQHVLQISLPETIRIWEEHNMKFDSSLGYAEKSGYRCGTGNFYNLFDVLNSTELNLVEMPLIIMDVTLRRYENLAVEEANNKINYFINKSKKYNSPITLLFHNSNFYGKEWKGWKQIYNNIDL